MMFSWTRSNRFAAAAALFAVVTCARLAPASATTLENGVVCSSDDQCNSGACYLGQQRDKLVGTCHCRGRCDYSGCAGCPTEQKCTVPRRRLRANTCVDMVPTATPAKKPTAPPYPTAAPPPMKSVAPTPRPTKEPITPLPTRPPTGSLRMGAECTSGSQCISGACWLGKFGKSAVGQCHCSECSKSRCGGCRNNMYCEKNKQAMNQCKFMPGMPTREPTGKPIGPPTPEPNLSYEIGARCRDNSWCRTKKCFKKGVDPIGRCECKVECSTSRCGGCLEKQFHCASAGENEPKYCKRIPTIATGNFCMHDAQCISGSCWKPNRETGWEIKAHCQCIPNDIMGKSIGCAKSQICEARTGESNDCIRYRPSAQPTAAPSSTPTLYNGKKFSIGETCIYDAMCRTKLCYRGRTGKAKNGVCECRPCTRPNCSECTRKRMCMDNGNLKNTCVSMPTTSPTNYPTSSEPTVQPTDEPSDTPSEIPTDGPTKSPAYPTGWPTRTKLKIGSGRQDSSGRTAPPTKTWLYTGESCVEGEYCVTGCCFYNKCKKPAWILTWLCN